LAFWRIKFAVGLRSVADLGHLNFVVKDISEDKKLTTQNILDRKKFIIHSESVYNFVLRK
jgi:hypothetical protein